MSTGPVDTHQLQQVVRRIVGLFTAKFDPDAHDSTDDREAVVEANVEALRPYAGSLGFFEEDVRAVSRVVVDRTRGALISRGWRDLRG